MRHPLKFRPFPQRKKLERLCRYITRPAVAEKCLSLSRNGMVRYELKTPSRDGTTHAIFEPLDFISKRRRWHRYVLIVRRRLQPINLSLPLRMHLMFAVRMRLTLSCSACMRQGVYCVLAERRISLR
ncbi:MAG: hypothetical protein GY726_07835 [Proteobacteria bacterium]|nr:hypothetical protein [Pseudomonadota bacterium]